MAEQQTSTQTDDVNVPSGDEDAQLSDILRNSPLAQQAGIVPTPEESLPEAETDPAEATEAEQDLAPEEEAAKNETDEAVEEEATTEDAEKETKSGDDKSTEAESYSLEELEDVMVTHKINGEEITLPLSEWIASSATKQHLSKQGREIGEQKKALEEERGKKLQELDQLGTALATSLMHNEQAHQKAYNDLSAKIEKATAEDDAYELGELTKRRTEAQRNYWEARNGREAVLGEVQKHRDADMQAKFNDNVKKFNEEIVKTIPDWSENVAKEVREFALQEGLPEQLLNVITDPTIVKFVYDYKNLKKGVKKGAVKRKEVLKLKTPVKRSQPEAKKEQDREQMIKARAFKQDASKEDQDAFMVQYARKSLGGN
jgi:hypothetical protein